MTTMTKKSLLAEIADTAVEHGHMTAWWLGGSGFVLKNSAGKTVYIDPYLSNSVEGIFGIGRGFPSPIAPEEARPDILIATHLHEDHLDPGTAPLIAKHSPNTVFVMPPTAASHAAHMNIPPTRTKALSYGHTFESGGFQITATPARHDAGILGWETPDAMGVLITSDDFTFYHTGDSEHDARLRNLRSHKIDAMTAPINGVTGNMDAHEAALLAWQLGAKVVIPHHHILWDRDTSGGEATLDPQHFADTYHRLGGQGRVVLPEIGVPIRL